MTQDTTPTSGAADLPEALRVPLDSLHADAGYLCGRLLNGSLTQEQVVESIHRRIDAAKLAALAALAAGQATAAPAQPAAQQGVAYAEMPDERAAFEAQFPVPGGVHWDGTEYVVKDSHVTSYRCNRFEGQWEAWKARASHGQAPAETGNSVSAQADSVQEDALDAEVLRDAVRYRFIRDVPYSDDVRSVLVHQQNAAMDRVIDAALAARKQGGA